MRRNSRDERVGLSAVALSLSAVTRVLTRPIKRGELMRDVEKAKAVNSGRM
jgi:hypothetical protein